MADIPRLTSEQKKGLTLRQLFEYEAASKPTKDPKNSPTIAPINGNKTVGK